MRTADRIMEWFGIIVITGGLAYFAAHIMGWLPMG